MSCAIRTYGLGRQFRRTVALDSLDLQVPEGAIYALAGPKRAGKTTCIRVLLNVLSPTAGRAEVLGTDSRRLGPRDFARIGYPAARQEMPGNMTVGYYLRFLSSFYPNWDAGVESALVRQFQLPLDRKLSAISPATRMKAALVSSLAYLPKLIVLDEPFIGLDPLSRAELLDGLLGRAADATIFLSAEDAAEVEAFATHLGYLEEGRLRFSEDLAALRARFREILLTFGTVPGMPDDWPATWLAPEAGPSTVRFIETCFDAERTPAEARRRFPEFHRFATNPMSLSDIVSAMARTWRTVP